MEPGFLRREGSCICCIPLRAALLLQPLSDCHGDLGNSGGDESHPWGGLHQPQHGHGAASLSCWWMYARAHHTHHVHERQLSKAYNSVKPAPVFCCTYQGDPFPCQDSFVCPQLLCADVKNQDCLLQGKCNLCTLMLQDEQASLVLDPSHFLPQPSHHHPHDKINEKAKVKLNLLSSLKSMLWKANIKFLFKPQETQTPL